MRMAAGSIGSPCLQVPKFASAQKIIVSLGVARRLIRKLLAQSRQRRQKLVHLSRTSLHPQGSSVDNGAVWSLFWTPRRAPPAVPNLSEGPSSTRDAMTRAARGLALLDTTSHRCHNRPRTERGLSRYAYIGAAASTMSTKRARSANKSRGR